RLQAEGTLTGPAALWMRPTKPFEELYDTEADPHEINNLADSAKYTETLVRRRKLHLDWVQEPRAMGTLPAGGEHVRAHSRTRNELGQERKAFPQAQLLEAAELLVAKEPVGGLLKRITDEDSAVRWWAATGLGVRGKGSREAEAALTDALKDQSPVVRVAA